MPYVEANGQRLYVEDTGGDGPPIVLSHGFLMDRRMFAPQVAELREVYRVVTWDERGFGATDFDGRPFTYWDSARDVFAILDALGIERAVLGGMSQGGFLSMRAALLHPDRVRALVLVDTQAPADPPDRVADLRVLLDTWAEHGYLDELATTVGGLLIGDPVVEATWKDTWRAWDHTRMAVTAGALFGRDDISDRLEELAMPVLLVHGTEDTAIPVGRAHEICAAIDDCRGVVEVEGAGHAPNLTHPDVVNPAIRAFLEGLPA